jgi:hypothetical protein
MKKETAVLDRKLAFLQGALNYENKRALFKAVDGVEEIEDLPQPYKTWINDLDAIPTNKLSYGAKMERKQSQVDTVGSKASAPSPVIEWIEDTHE